MIETSSLLSWGAATDRGLRRPANEDSFIAQPPIFLVADGMGGHDAGADASRAAVTGFESLIGLPTVTVTQVEDAFRAAVAGVGSIVSERHAAGTTLAGVAVTESAGLPYWLVLNIGDSRVYRLAHGDLEQISTDHSAVQAMLDRGEIDAREAEQHPQRNVVTRAVGAGSSGVPDYWLLPAASEDRIMICSDGLSKELTDADILRVLQAEPAAQAAATRLVHEALVRGGRDNVTVVVVDAHRIALDDEPTVPGFDAGHDDGVDEDTVPRSSGPEEGVRDADL